MKQTSTPVFSLLYFLFYCTSSLFFPPELSTTVGTATEAETTPWPGSVAPLDTITVACEKDSMHVNVGLAKSLSRYVKSRSMVLKNLIVTSKSYVLVNALCFKGL